MTIVTLTIEPGTFGTDFPARVAAAIGLRLVDQTSLERTVADHGWDEDGVINGFLNADRPSINRWPMTLGQFAYRFKEQVLSEVAGGHVVFAGWAAASILQPMGLGVRLHITASLDHRAGRIGRQHAYSDIGPALVEIEHLDGATARYLAAAFDADPAAASLHDHDVVADQLSETECIALVRDIVIGAAGACEQVAVLPESILSLLETLRAEEMPPEERTRTSTARH